MKNLFYFINKKIFYKRYFDSKVFSMSQPTEPLLKFERNLEWIEINKISPNPYNPRETISKEEVSDIRDSIKEIGGILVPLVVMEDETGNYILLDGERRWRAAQELSETDDTYLRVPANIVKGELNKSTNVRVMFNIHMQRKQWSTAAIAESISDILHDEPSISVKELAKQLHVSEATIRLAQHFDRMPTDLKLRSLNEELPEYYLIFLSQNLYSVQRSFPGLIEKYGFDNLSRIFIDKVDNGLIKSADDFRLISKMIKKSINYKEKSLFIDIFDRLVQDEYYTPKNADVDLDEILGSRIDDLFNNFSRKFLKSLNSYEDTLMNRHRILTQRTAKILINILSKIDELVNKFSH